MKIYTSLTWDMESGAILDEQSYEYDGPVALCCGADSSQKQIEQQQQSFSNQVQQQASQVFGNSSTVFSDLMNTFAPTIAAGPSQEGFSAAEKSNLNSQAITNTGVAYRNAKTAVGQAQSAQGGGNTPDVSGGSKVATDLGVATSAAQQTSNELGQINEADYATGRQNYDTAVQGLTAAPGVYGTSASLDNAQVNSSNAAANTANQIASANNSWIQGVTGALGGIAGGVASGGMSNLGKGVGFFGGSGATGGKASG